MSFDPEPAAVLIEKSTEGITTITINRPHKRNAVDERTAAKLYSAFFEFDRDETQKVAILTGANGTFCAGYDLATVGTAANQPSGDEKGEVVSPQRGPMGPSRMRLAKPLIAAVTGYAVAGGLELSLLADMRVAEDDAVFGVFCRRWGVPLIDGGTVRLPRIVGMGRAMDMILTGRPVEADEALAMGLINRKVARGTALREARKLALELTSFPQQCMRSDMLSAYYASFDSGSLEDALANEGNTGMKIVQLESVAGAERFRKGAGRHGAFEYKSKL